MPDADRNARREVINSVRTHVAAVLIGTCLIFFYVMMPVTLGAAAESRGYDDRQLGFIASSFMVGVFFVTAAGFFWLRRYHWRSVLYVCIAVAAAAYSAAIAFEDYSVLLVSICVCGIACGAGYSITIACLGDSDVPERGFGLTWGVQTLLGVAASYLLPRLANGEHALTVSLSVFLGMALFAALFVPMMPARGLKGAQAIVTNEVAAEARAMRPVVFIGFAVIVLVFLAESGLWAYLDRIAVAAGMTRQFAGTAIAASLLAAAASSFLAAAIGQRFGRMLPMTIAILASVFSAWLFYTSRNPTSFLLAAVIYGAAWNFGGPYRMALIAEADVTGRYVAAITAMQTLGSVIGPGMAGLLATSGTYDHIYLTAGIAWLLALALFQIANRRFERLRLRVSNATATPDN